MTLPPDIPYLKQEAEQAAAAFIYKAPDSKWIGSPSGYAILNRNPQPVDGQTVSRFLSLHSDLSYHESRFLAARWLEAISRPGWRFLDGPSALTAEQSARVLHEACLRARDGATAIVGVLGPEHWDHKNLPFVLLYRSVVIGPEGQGLHAQPAVTGDPRLKEDTTGHITINWRANPLHRKPGFFQKMPTTPPGEISQEATAFALANGWFCL